MCICVRFCLVCVCVSVCISMFVCLWFCISVFLCFRVCVKSSACQAVHSQLVTNSKELLSALHIQMLVFGVVGIALECFLAECPAALVVHKQLLTVCKRPALLPV